MKFEVAETADGKVIVVDEEGTEVIRFNQNNTHVFLDKDDTISCAEIVARALTAALATSTIMGIALLT